MQNYDIYCLQQMDIDVWIPQQKKLIFPQAPCTHTPCASVMSLVPEYILIFYTTQPSFFESLQSMKKNRFIQGLLRTLNWQEDKVALVFLTSDPCHESTICASSLKLYLDSYTTIPCMTVLKGISSEKIYRQYPFLRFSDDRISFVIEYDQLTKNWQQKKLLMEQMWLNINRAQH